MHGTEGRRQRRAQQVVKQGRDVVRRRPPARLGQRLEQPRMIDFLMRHMGMDAGVVGVGQDQQRRPVEGGVGDAVHGGRRARPQTRRDDARRAHQFAGDRRHDRRRGLSMREHVVDAANRAGVDDLEVRTAAGNPENPGNAVLAQDIGNGPGDGCAGHRAVIRRRSTRCGKSPRSRRRRREAPRRA